MLTIAAFVSLAVGIWEDYSPNHPQDEPRIRWFELHSDYIQISYPDAIHSYITYIFLSVFSHRVEGTAILVAVAAVVFTSESIHQLPWHIPLLAAISRSV